MLSVNKMRMKSIYVYYCVLVQISSSSYTNAYSMQSWFGHSESVTFRVSMVKTLTDGNKKGYKGINELNIKIRKGAAR